MAIKSVVVALARKSRPMKSGGAAAKSQKRSSARAGDDDEDDAPGSASSMAEESDDGAAPFNLHRRWMGDLRHLPAKDRAALCAGGVGVWARLQCNVRVTVRL